MHTFIVNPNSRSGLGLLIWKQIKPILVQRNVPFKTHFTKYQGHATQIVKTLTSNQQFHTIVILGGDGTVSEVINGVVDYKKVTLGYIPSGSSNDFARGLHLPTNPIEALDSILSSRHHQYLDVGVLSFNGKKRMFAVSSGIGFDAAICHQAAISKLKVLLNKIKLGKLTYLGIALQQLTFSSPQTISISLDGGVKQDFEKSYFVSVMNTPYEGGGFKFCPDANASDGVLNICVASGLSKLKVLMLLPTAFFGKHIYFKGISTFTCKHVTIETTKPLPVHVDGEPIFLKRHIEATCAPEQIRIITTS